MHKKKPTDLTPGDEAHLHKVHSYGSRHSAPGPQYKDDVETSRWRYSLLNWEHAPQKQKVANSTKSSPT